MKQKESRNVYLKKRICIDCSVEFYRGFKSFRCESCQINHEKELKKGHDRNYYKKNKKKLDDYKNTWFYHKYHTDEEYRKRNNHSSKNQSAKRKGSIGSHTYDEWVNVLKNNEFACKYCGKKEPDIKLTVDHVVPISRGGINNISNIQPLCLRCNVQKRQMLESEFLVKREEGTKGNNTNLHLIINEHCSC